MRTYYFKTRACCPACESEFSKVIYECKFLQEPVVKFLELKFRPEVLGYFDGESYILKKCRNCGLIYQGRILNDEGLSLLYDRWLFEGDKEIKDSGRTETQQFLYYSQELLKIRMFFNKPVGEIKVLDYGMGRGRWCVVARALGFQVIGTDLSDEFLAHGRQLGLDVLPLSELSGRSFDFINTEQVFEHLNEPLVVLKHLRGLLSENGVIKISVPYGANIEKRIHKMDWAVPRGHKNFLVPITPAIHINTFSYGSLVEMGKAANLEPISVPLAFEYRLWSGLSFKDFFKSLARPIYRRFAKYTYVFFRRC